MSSRLILLALAFFVMAQAAAQESPVQDPDTGLVVDANWELVRANCSGCHSLKLVTQNRMSASSWQHTIAWMQEKHNLWDLGVNEASIIAYLEKHYGIPSIPHRRQPLDQPPIDTQDSL